MGLALSSDVLALHWICWASCGVMILWEELAEMDIQESVDRHCGGWIGSGVIFFALEMVWRVSEISYSGGGVV
ncbi:hypothetical protein M758_8G116200 [Ceratodon purpureus]|nr:hypothetical protein M758_8G116200 [Ceratodon purpureus]KAG0608576.1 hypothetical protein M758_8G116200 [Ceratodon purpureus]